MFFEGKMARIQKKEEFIRTLPNRYGPNLPFPIYSGFQMRNICPVKGTPGNQLQEPHFVFWGGGTFWER